MTNAHEVLIFAEKPSQAKSYSAAYEVEKRDKTSITLKPCSTFPKGAIITWGIGHLVGLKMPGDYKEEWKRWSLDNLPVFPNEHQYVVSKDKKIQYMAVKSLFEKCQILVNACDVDREGSNIFYSTLAMTGVKGKTIKRLWINSLEVDEIRKGFDNLLDNKKDLLMYEEAKTRQIADWLVGMNASQLYTILIGKKGLKDESGRNPVLSVGRVQSPLVYMIYSRQKEIENFKPMPFYELFAEFKSDKGNYKGKAKIKESEKEVVTSLLTNKGLKENEETQAHVKSIEKVLKKEKSPRLHSLSTLQTLANKKWKYSPATVLSTVQSLYEKKLVTYPRTDCNFITENEFSYLTKNIKDYQKLLNVSFEPNITPNKRYVDNKAVQEHYAIVLTKQIPTDNTLKSLSKEEQSIYNEILKTTVAMYHKDYEFEETRIITDVESIEFHTKGKVELDKGWKILFQENNKENEEQNDMLPALNERDEVLGQLQIKEGITTPPKPYTEGGLINLMKNAGSGLENEEDVDILKEVEGIGTEATRSGIIETIKKNQYIDVKKNIVSVTNKGIILCEAIEGNLLASPVMTAKWESYLKKIGTGEKQAQPFLENIKKFLSKTIEEAPNKLNETNISSFIEKESTENSIGTCPLCKQGQILDKKVVYGCSEYSKGCSFAIFKKMASKTLTKKNIKDLLEKGKTTKIKGFKSKAGKSFEAYVELDKDHKTKFVFDKK